MKGWTEHDLAQIEKRDGYAINQQLGSKHKGSSAEVALALALEAEGIEGWEREYRFRSDRRWRLDFAWPQQQLAVEIEGITHDGGRHQRVDGFSKDIEKYEAAMLDGWVVYRTTPRLVLSGRALQVIRQMLENLEKTLVKTT